MQLSPIIGHRGCKSLAPENTLASIRKAAEVGAQWVEIDVVLVGDGSLVIHHDQSLKRCTNGQGRILSSSLEELLQLDAGSWFAAEYKGEKIPTLEQALTLIQQLGLGLNLEIKMHKHSVRDLVLPVLNTLDKTWQNPETNLVISSFSHEVLQLCHHHPYKYLLGHLFEKLPDNWQALAQEVDAISIHTEANRLTKAQAQAIKQAGYELYCYTVNQEDLANKLWRWGVDGIFTDYPQIFIK